MRRGIDTKRAEVEKGGRKEWKKSKYGKQNWRMSYAS